jgi:hypothetical protein
LDKKKRKIEIFEVDQEGDDKESQVCFWDISDLA